MVWAASAALSYKMIKRAIALRYHRHAIEACIALSLQSYAREHAMN